MNGFTNIVNGFSQVAIDALKAQADALYITEEPPTEWTEIAVTTSQLEAYDMSTLSEQTKFLVSDGTISSAFTIDGNTVPIWIDAVNQGAVTVTNNIIVNSDDVTFSGALFTGSDAWVDITGDRFTITKNVFDNCANRFQIRSQQCYDGDISYNTIKNFHHISGNPVSILIYMMSWADDPTPANHHVHHNYFEDLTTDTDSEFGVIQPRLRQSTTEDQGFGEQYGDASWNWGDDEYKDDNVQITDNYYENCDDTFGGKMNGIHFERNTVRNSAGASSFRSGKNGVMKDNFFFNVGDGSEPVKLIDRGHICTGNYIDRGGATGGLGGITVMNGGFLSSTNKYAPCRDVTVSNNYLEDMERGVYFGLKIDETGADDLAPSGDVINNFFKTVTTAIHVNTSGEPLMDEMTTTPNDTDTSTSWDLSGAFDATDVADGTVGAGV